mmetsp:Transcript_41668/g.107852  ORF Transcript_41668/g.107852 Transcript_41668/m.107852 type:complete len:210 (-) Transcript_41668:1934-2563(-)
MTHAAPFSSICRAIQRCCWSGHQYALPKDCFPVMTSLASSTMRATSHRFTALTARFTLSHSVPAFIRPLRRMPAVSTKRYTLPVSDSRYASMQSVVVPGMSLTIARSSPMSALSSDDLPALGFPTMATLTASSFGLGGASSPRIRSGYSPSQPLLITVSMTSHTPRPCRQQIGIGSPSSRPQNSAALRSIDSRRSHLATARTTFSPRGT